MPGGGIGNGDTDIFYDNTNPANEDPRPILANTKDTSVDGILLDNDEDPPCKILKKQTTDNPVFQTKLDSLMQLVIDTNPNPATTETAIAVKKTTNFTGNDTITFKSFNENTIGNGTIQVKRDMSEWDIASIHNHPINTIPIFSHKDIVDLFISVNFVKPQRKHEYTSYLVCFNGATYALRMENITALATLFEGLDLETASGKAEAETRVEKIFKKNGLDKNQNYTQGMAENLFLSVLNDPSLGGGNGANLFRKDGTTWTRLRKSGNTVHQQDCN